MGEEGPPEWVIGTQQSLGSLIKRPKFTDALLQKPPFRFLHDVVSEVTKVTGYADGLYEESERDSGKVKVCPPFRSSSHLRLVPTLTSGCTSVWR